MRWLLPVVLAFGAAFGAAEPKEDPSKKELDQLQGTWILDAGDDLNEFLPTNSTLVIKGRTWALNPEGYRWSPADDSGRGAGTGTFTIDPGKKPKTIDLKLTPDKKDEPGLINPNLSDVPILGIYGVEGDRLKMCFGSTRPTEFAAKKADADVTGVRVALTWKRETHALGEAKQRVVFKAQPEVNALWFVGDKSLATFGANKPDDPSRTVKVWDLATRKEVTSYTSETGEFVQPTITADGRTLLTICPHEEGHRLKTRDVRAGTERTSLNVRGPISFSAALTPDGKYMVAGGRDESMRGASGHKDTFKVWEVKTGKEVFKWEGGNKYQQIQEVAIGPDGKCVAWRTNRGLASRYGGFGLVVLHGETPKEVELRVPARDFRDTNVESMKIAADGKALALAFAFEHRRGGDDGGEVIVWDLPTGKQRPLTLKCQQRPLLIALSPDGKTLATVVAGTTAVVTLWDVEKARAKVILKHDADVRALEFNPNGKALAVATGSDVKVWDLPE